MTGLSKAERIQQASDLLRAARHAVAFTGAGISTPSGIPDFRSAGTGLWTQNDPMEIASLTAFRVRPAKFFNWLRPLAGNIRAAQPNPAHTALAHLERAGRIQAVITQNIDGLHQRAGSRCVLELHGSLEELVCPRCRRSYPIEPYWNAFIEDGAIPLCPEDHANLKPGIVLYEEMLPEQTWAAAEVECRGADLVLVAGSSLEVGPANMLPVYALQQGAKLVINTLSPTILDQYADVLLPYDIAEVIPAIAEKTLG